jgi:Holliday junction resolvasome RuvABC endonuclease subunit
MKAIAGIDYSMTSPACCVYVPDDSIDDAAYKWKFDNLKFMWLTNEDRYIGSFMSDKFVGKKGYTADKKAEDWKKIERYSSISCEFMDFMDENDVQSVLIESYSFASKGMTFHIGENTGILKYMLFSTMNDYDIVAPTTIKKYACGTSHKVDKDMMYDAFLKDTGFDLKGLLGFTKKKAASPIADIVDAYWICKYNWHVTYFSVDTGT